MRTKENKLDKNIMTKKRKGDVDSPKSYQTPKIYDLGSLTEVTLGGTGGLVEDSGNGTAYRYQ